MTNDDLETGVAGIKFRYAEKVASETEAAVSRKCVNPETGLPMIAKDKVQPRPGSVINPKSAPDSVVNSMATDVTGDCPECHAHVTLTSKGHIGSHMVGNGPSAPSLAMSSASVEPTDTGVRVGDPASADKRRSAENGAALGPDGHGTVEIPVKQANGRTKLVEVPMTHESLGEAFDYWVSRKPRTGAGRAEQSRMVSQYRKLLEVASEPSVWLSGGSGETDVNRGAALVKGSGKTMAGPVNKEIADAEVDHRSGYAASAGTMGAPLGRDRADKDVTEGGDVRIIGGKYGNLTFDQVGKLNKTDKRAYFRWIKANEKAKRKASRSNRFVPRDIAPSVIGRSRLTGEDVTNLTVTRK